MSVGYVSVPLAGVDKLLAAAANTNVESILTVSHCSRRYNFRNSLIEIEFYIGLTFSCTQTVSACVAEKNEYMRKPNKTIGIVNYVKENL